MRKIILDLTTSLDGFIEGPAQEIDWILFDKETADVLNRLAAEVDTVIYGRVSYETRGNYSPPEDSMEEVKTFYAAVNTMRKYVFSRSLSKAKGEGTLINENFR